MENLNYVFQTDSEEIKNAFANQSNYLIEYSKTLHSDIKYCIIYFSSNNLYYPNNAKSFQRQVLKKNRFEWYSTRINIGEKHIFIRDIKKQWYLSGINEEINSIEKLYEFLLEETNGYNVIVLGSSAGGYAAVLLGSMINAERILTFNGQFKLHDLLSEDSMVESTEMLNPIIFREKDNPNINKYYSLRPYICNPKNIYYFYSEKSKWDLSQLIHVSDFDMNLIPFKTGHHGVPFLKSNLNAVINLPIAKLNLYVGKKNRLIIFSFQVDGLYKTILDITRLGFKHFLKIILFKKKF